jgi:hypothetical protein
MISRLLFTTVTMATNNFTNLNIYHIYKVTKLSVFAAVASWAPSNISVGPATDFVDKIVKISVAICATV